MLTPQYKINKLPLSDKNLFSELNLETWEKEGVFYNSCTKEIVFYSTEKKEEIRRYKVSDNERIAYVDDRYWQRILVDQETKSVESFFQYHRLTEFYPQINENTGCQFIKSVENLSCRDGPRIRIKIVFSPEINTITNNQLVRHKIIGGEIVEGYSP